MNVLGSLPDGTKRAFSSNLGAREIFQSFRRYLIQIKLCKGDTSMSPPVVLPMRP